MKKKTYLAPEMKMVVIDQADIIATSGGYNDGNMRIGGSDGIEMGEEEF